ncbi:MAG TPA: BNR repeat-containing protein, partial [Candidatus Hydrogenedentes bacterium]|nr:BNR repeat-containing protein [Candidatus Hydrogenedentota bacterium]
MIMLIFALLIGLPSASVEAALDVAPVWSGHPVGFCLLTAPPHQFVAFYDAERRMTVAQRALEESAWRLTRLDQEIGWDSHNSVTMALDDAGFLHLSGNMHCVPLIYYRSEKPFDAASLVRVPAMVGRDEQMVTYPRFLRGPAGELVFLYRDGRSGSGNEIFNAYDVETRAWRRLLEKPLTDGEGARNAYFEGPVAGPDGYFHLCWVWRESPDCETNHDLSYARSKDLVHWECSDGAPYTLPITLATSEGVDPVPEGGGIINGNARIGFDGAGRVVISYHKH